MQEELTNFANYYKTKHSGHALDWDHDLGTATLKARFIAGVKELSVSLYQAVVLLLFNDSVQLAFQDIQEQTRMGDYSKLFKRTYNVIDWLITDDGELRRTLQSLACGKKKVLKKIPPGRDVNDDDMFLFNADFDHPRPRIHINSIQAKVSVLVLEPYHTSHPNFNTAFRSLKSQREQTKLLKVTESSTSMLLLCAL